MNDQIDRRQLLGGIAAVGAAGTLGTLAEAAQNQKLNGRIKQSVVYWCFNSAGERWNLERTCQVARELGVPSVEIVAPEDWPTLRKHNLVCAIAPNGMPGAPFMRGFNNP